MSITTAVLAKEKQMLHSVSVHTQRYNQACINSEFIYALAYVCLSRLECGRVFCWSRILQGGENVVECTGPPPPQWGNPWDAMYDVTNKNEANAVVDGSPCVCC